MAEAIRRAQGALTVVALVIGLAAVTGIGVQGSATGQVQPCQDDDYEQDDEDCWQSHLATVGSVETHRLCDPDWFELNVLQGATYVVETRNLVGGADTLLEVWSMAGTGSCWVYGLPSFTDDDGGVGFGSRVEWVASYSTWRLPYSARTQGRVTGKAYGDGMGYDLSVECVANCPPEGEILVVPWVERGVGSGGGLLRTELRLHNPWPEQAAADLIPRTGEGNHQAQVSVGAGHEVRVDDVVAELFGLDTAAGPLQVRTPDRPLVGLAWVFEERPGGGGRVGHVMSSRALDDVPLIQGSYGLYYQATFELGGLEESAAVDTRVVLSEVIGRSSGLEIILRAADGSLLGEREHTLEGWGTLALEDLFGFFNASPQAGASLDLVGTGTGRVVGLAVVRDLESFDSIAPQGLAAGRWQMVPAVASVAGAFGSHWTSDLVVSALPTWGQVEVELTFLPRDGWNVGLEPVVLTLEPGESRVIEDVVDWLGASGAGALRVDGSGLTAWSRTVNHGAGGDVSQWVPSVGVRSAVGLGDGTLVALGVDGSPMARANVGWVNVGDDTGTVEVRLVAADGTLLGSGDFALRPSSPHQVNDVFARLGVALREGCRAELEVVQGEAQLLAYVSRVDNLSGDAVFVPAVRVPRRDLEPVVLSNRNNCVLVDHLPEAVGVDRLPGGIFTASMSGDAWIGPRFTDLELVCLYRDLDGNLGVVLLNRYVPLDGIAGDAPFWCLAPDRVTRDDNGGTVRLTVGNGVDELTFAVDARTDTVLVDQLPEAVVVEHPHPSYHLLTRGDLGRPGLEPHLLLAYRAGWSERSIIAVGGQGFWPHSAWPVEPLAAVVLDWINADDNTGESLLVPVEDPYGKSGRLKPKAAGAVSRQ